MSKTLGATLLIVGTSIGAGMLGLPVETGRAGFYPSIFIMALVWIATTCSAILLTDVVIQGKKGENFFSLSERYFGSFVRGLTLVFYFLLFFSLITAYVKGGGGFASDFFNFDQNSSGSLLFVVFLIPFIFFGPNLVDKINLFLIVVLFGCYFLLVFAGIKYVDLSFLAPRSFASGFLSMPLIITAFSYHGTLPTIVEYLERDSRKVKKAILFGSTVVFVIYIVWQYLIIGIIPFSGGESLLTALEADKTAMMYLETVTKSRAVAQWSVGFSFAALTTSFLGISLGVIDFFCDAFKKKQTLKNRVFIANIIIIPALILSTLKFPIFYFSLKYGAGISCIFLLIFLPAAMWKRIKEKEKVFFGLQKKYLVYFLYCFSLAAFFVTVFGSLFINA